MTQAFSNDYKLSIITVGTESGTWGGITNNNLLAVAQAIGGRIAQTLSSTSETIGTPADNNSLQNFRALFLDLSGSPGGACEYTVPAIEKTYIVKNGTNQQVTVKVSGQTGVAIPAGKTTIVYVNGTDVVDTITYASSLVLGAALPVASGGTGSTSTTYCNLTSNVTGTLPVGNGGTGSTNTTYCSLTSNVTGTLPVANGGTGVASVTSGNVLIGNGTSALSVLAGSSTNDVLTWNGSAWVSQAPSGGGGGGGTVTSVSGTGSVQGITLSGTVTSSGNLTLGGTFSAVSLTSQVSGVLGFGNGGTGATSFPNQSIPLSNGSSFGNLAFNGQPANAVLYSTGSAPGFAAISALEPNLAFRNTSIAPTSDNTYSLGSGSLRWATVFAATGTINTSDSRLKNSITSLTNGLDFINRLNPVSYKWNETKSVTNEFDPEATQEITTSAGVRKHLGFVAQEVQTVLNESTMSGAASNYAMWCLQNSSDSTSEQMLRYDQFIAPLVKAVQELSAKVTTLEAKVQQLEAE